MNKVFGIVSILKERNGNVIGDHASTRDTRSTHWLRLKLRFSKDRALSKPSGTCFKLLQLKSNVVNSSRWNNSAGIPLDLTLLRLTFNVRRQPSSVNSPYKRSTLLLTNERCSCWKKKEKVSNLRRSEVVEPSIATASFQILRAIKKQTSARRQFYQLQQFAHFFWNLGQVGLVQFQPLYTGH